MRKRATGEAVVAHIDSKMLGFFSFEKGLVAFHCTFCAACITLVGFTAGLSVSRVSSTLPLAVMSLSAARPGWRDAQWQSLSTK